LALLAEGVGFEPTVPVDPGLRFSRPLWRRPNSPV
jgi:hypothetical protein